MNRLQEAEKLIQEFVDRVDKGEVRSTKTYTKFKEFLGLYSIYYYEDKPYRVLHDEGKIKATSILMKIEKSLHDEDYEPEIEEQMAASLVNKELEKKNLKWIDVVVYEPLYEECDIRICVKEKEDFYNNYKPKTNESNS